MSHRFDERLPVLEELGHAIRVAAARADEERAAVTERPTQAASVTGTPRRPSPTGRRGRVQRRALTLAALLCAATATATATVAIVGDHGGRPSARTDLAADVARLPGSDHVVLRAYPRGRQACLVLTVLNDVDTVCLDPPKRGRLRARSMVGGDSRVVYGLAGPAVSRVRVTVGSVQRDAGVAPVPRRAAPTAGATAWIAVVPRVLGGRQEPPARMRARIKGRTGPILTDCSLGQLADACR